MLSKTLSKVFPPHAISKTGVFESMFCSMIFVGEESGTLDEILEKTSDYYEDESDTALQRLIGIMDPIRSLF